MLKKKKTDTQQQQYEFKPKISKNTDQILKNA